MKRLLLLLPLLLTAPVNAQVDPAVHKLCSDVKDYAGCVQTQMSLGSKSKKESIKKNDRDIQSANTWEITVTQQEYDECMAKSRSLWDQWTDAEKKDAIEKAKKWKPGDPYTKPCSLPGTKTRARTGDGSQPDKPWVSDNGCPPGTRQYQKTALFGLVKGAKLCLSDYEAESLKQAQFQNAITNMNQNMNRNRIINCTSNTWGSYMSTTCY